MWLLRSIMALSLTGCIAVDCHSYVAPIVVAYAPIRTDGIILNLTCNEVLNDE
jgi:hypothetical protein